MSVLNQSGEEQVECPLCMEPLEVDDLHFYPCTCGYQICRFCWNRIREGENGLCPACRKAYPENPADFTPLSQEQVAAIKTEKKAREQKRRNKTLESRKALANVRVVQNNLVFVVGLPVRLADPEILKRQEYFGKYGKIHKVVINQSTTYAGTQGPSASAYVTYLSSADALRAIQGVNNVTLDGRVLKGSLGTTKYCANFMKNQPCPKPDCMYLHELGDPKASFTKEEMHAGLHQVYERKLHNQLLALQKDATNNSSGNSSTNAEKGSTKDGNPSNFIPTTAVTAHINNVVNSSKSNKKESLNGNHNSNGSSSSGSSSSASSGSGGGQDAWPSLGSSPPATSPAPSGPPPQTHNKHKHSGKSQENGTSESSSPTLSQQVGSKNKDHDHGKHRKDSQPNKRSKSDKKKSNNTNSHEESEPTPPAEPSTFGQPINNTSVFTTDSQYLTNELDELESDRHSLLENHDLLNNSNHSLLEDDSTHNLLNDANNDALIMQRHREMLAGLVDTHNMMPKPINGFYDRNMGYERPVSQISQAMMDQKELLLRERSRSEMLMRQNEMLARHHNAMAEPKHYMPTNSIGLDSASELLGNNFHPNTNMLPPFGMRMDNMSNSMNNSINSMANPMMGNMPNMGYGQMMPTQQMPTQQMPTQQMPTQQMPSAGMVNGFDSPQSNETRYLSENMDKFFTDFHKAQQMRLVLGVGQSPSNSQHGYQHHHNEHKHRMSGRTDNTMGARCGGDGDDDLDFDPFKETQKALAEMMQTEMMHSNVSSGDNMDRMMRSRLAPPGFSNASRHNIAPQHHNNHHQAHGYPMNNAYSDWTQMDPAIVSTSVAPCPAPLAQQQHELFARFNQLQVKSQPQSWGGKMPWAATPYSAIPLPPGFAPQKQNNRPEQCIESK